MAQSHVTLTNVHKLRKFFARARGTLISVRFKKLHQLLRVVLGTVVDEDDFEIRIIDLVKGFQARRQRLAAIVRAHNHRHLRVMSQANVVLHRGIAPEQFFEHRKSLFRFALTCHQTEFPI